MFTASSLLAGAAFIWTAFGAPTRLIGNSFGVLPQNVTYDYVVIGGGTAGLTIAGRLVEKGASVAVVEAGGFYEQDNGNYSQVPGYSSTFMTFANLNPPPIPVDWELVTDPQAGLNGRKIHYSAGRTLGGSSAFHAVYHRPSKGSLDQWSDAVGDDSYKWNNFVPYLKKTFAFTPPNFNKIDKKTPIPYDPSAYSPNGGPLQLSFPNYREPFDAPMEKGFAKSGFKSINGFNSGKLNGYGPGTYTINPKDQTRSTSAWGFLRQAIDTNTMPPNLKIYIKTMAKKINFDATKKATGVTVNTNGAEYILSARKEVILSAGVFHSPQVLMVSGLGPAATLQGHGIPVVSDLQGVGQNMEDHVFVFTSHQTTLTTNSAVLADPQLHAAAVQKYLNEQDGPLTGVGGDVIGFEKFTNASAFSPATKNELSKYPSDFPDVEYLGLSFSSFPANSTTPTNNNNYVYVAISLQTISSKGYVNITSADTNDRPAFNPNLLATKRDQELAVQAVKRARAIADGSGVKVAEASPGPAVQTDDQILAWIKDHAVVGDHAGCTCAMGKKGDPMAVVDSQARVFGVSGLRVVDASAMPFLPPGHPYSSVYALAEKIAVDITG